MGKREELFAVSVDRRGDVSGLLLAAAQTSSPMKLAPQ